MTQRLFAIKPELDINDLMFLQGLMLFALGFTAVYLEQQGLPMVITSLREHANGRESLTHTQGRAVDISVRGWGHARASSVCDYLNEKLSPIAAISTRTGERTFCVYHMVEGSEFHLHLQVAPSHSVAQSVYQILDLKQQQ